MKITKNQKKLINDWSHLVNQQSSNKQLKSLYNYLQNKYDNIKNHSKMHYRIFTYMPMFFDTLQHKLQGLCLLTQLIPSSHTQSISQIHNTVHLSGETSAECAQFTIMETMNNTATMSSISNISCDSSILCNTHSLYNTCIFAEN
jgi:hypothetical protein